MRCAELTELCLELRCAVLRQSYPEQEVRRMVMREILEAKERRWRQMATRPSPLTQLLTY